MGFWGIMYLANNKKPGQIRCPGCFHYYPLDFDACPECGRANPRKTQAKNSFSDIIMGTFGHIFIVILLVIALTFVLAFWSKAAMNRIPNTVAYYVDRETHSIYQCDQNRNNPGKVLYTEWYKYNEETESFEIILKKKGEKVWPKGISYKNEISKRTSIEEILESFDDETD